MGQLIDTAKKLKKQALFDVGVAVYLRRNRLSQLRIEVVLVLHFYDRVAFGYRELVN